MTRNLYHELHEGILEETRGIYIIEYPYPAHLRLIHRALRPGLLCTDIHIARDGHTNLITPDG